MDNYINVGKIINTFGIKGEVKVLSDFEYKDRIFKNDFSLYIGYNKDKEVISNYRVHKNYDLLTFKGYSNINDVLKYKGSFIYIKRCDLKLSEGEYLLSDLIGYEVYDNTKLIGVVYDYERNNNNDLIKVKGEKSFYIPINSYYIKKVVKEEKKIVTEKGSDLIL